MTWNLFSDAAQILSDVIKMGLRVEKPRLMRIEAAADAHVREVDHPLRSRCQKREPVQPPSRTTVFSVPFTSREDEELPALLFGTLTWT